MRSIDRRLALAGTVVLASGLLLVVGLISIVVALNDDNVGLPEQGSLQEILEERDSAGDGEVDSNAADAPPPVRLAIPRIGVDAPVLTMGLDADKYPEVPNAGDEVAWYKFSAPPGRGSNAVFSGHVDWYYWDMPVKGVFYHLRELQLGDEISVDMEDGGSLRYRVTGNVAISYDDPNVIDVMDPTSKDVITLVTCGGTWLKDYSNPNGGNYTHRIVVRAERVQDLATGQTADGG